MTPEGTTDTPCIGSSPTGGELDGPRPEPVGASDVVSPSAGAARRGHQQRGSWLASERDEDGVRVERCPRQSEDDKLGRVPPRG